MQTELVQFICETIQATGPQPFGWFMEQALYHPEHGYYSTGRAIIGRHGDYITNISIGPLFGRLLATQFVEIWERLGQANSFTIVEQGAHDGQFARDVLSALRERAGEAFEAVRYKIVEPFPILQERQSDMLQEFADRVSWENSLTDLHPFIGVYFSNELLDAIPVNLRNREVALDGDQLVLIENSNSSSPPNESQLTWMDDVSAKLQRGFVIAIDYGFPGTDFREVVQTRARHQYLDSPFEQIGEVDISVHINWSDIADRAEANGLHVAGFTDQHHFITGIISDSAGRVLEGSLDAKSKRELQTLLHPEMLGRAFQVLALSKGVDVSQPLAGFRFAREPRAVLGLKS